MHVFFLIVWLMTPHGFVERRLDYGYRGAQCEYDEGVISRAATPPGVTLLKVECVHEYEA